MKKIVFFIFLLGISLQSFSQFITTWRTTTDNESIIIPGGVGTNYDVDWGDGESSSGNTSATEHTYAEAGTYTVNITGNFTDIYFPSNTVNPNKILTIEQWGDQVWDDFNGSFWNCQNLQGNFIDAPNLSQVESMTSMFRNANKFNHDIGDWDTSNVKFMSRMFLNASSFNQNIGGWNVSNVEQMVSMFQRAVEFNQDIGDWSTSNVTNMSSLFFLATKFNQDISRWDVSNVTDMTNMLSNSGMSTDNYDALLIAWSQQNVQSNVTLGAEGIAYCSDAAAQARADLIANKNWTITDAGQDCSQLGINDFAINGNVSIYPNPTIDHLIISNADLTNSTVHITDISGKIVATQHINISQTNTRIDLPNITSGLYFLNVSSDRGAFSHKFLVK